MTPAPVTSRDDAAALDAADPLAHLRDRFELPEGVVYLDGNSLGPLPRGVRERLAHVVGEEWGRGLISSWNTSGWYEMPRRLGDRIGRLVGAGPGTLVVGDSTSVQVFKVLVAALRMRPGRRVLLTEPGNFPTDTYVAQSVARLTGAELRWAEPDGLVDALDDDVAVVAVSHVDYRSGRMHDGAAVTAAAHEAGALVSWDLAHSAGAVPVDLDGWDADLAVGCGYKYLNGGPGAPAFVYVNRRIQDLVDQPLAGWWGHAEPFALERDYRPAHGIARMLVGTAPVLSMSALDSALDAYEGVDMADVRVKSLALTDLFMTLARERLSPYGVEVEAPEDPTRRGSQVCLRHPEAYGLVQALIARSVVGDFREPDLGRFGFTPLYLRYVDVWDALEHAVQVLLAEEHLRPEYAERAAVT